MAFNGFQSGREKLTPIPETFFSEALAVVDDLAELKLILYAFWVLNQQQRDMQYLTLANLLEDEALSAIFQPETALKLRQALERATGHNLLISAEHQGEVLYFLNTPRGRAACQAIRQGVWTAPRGARPAPELGNRRPNIFTLYEENIGPLTPLMSDILQEAEETYPAEWIDEAIRIAVEKNVRNWRYIDAILKSWQKEGRGGKDRRHTQTEGQKYIEGEYGDIVEH
jgi:DNA replication protein